MKAKRLIQMIQMPALICSNAIITYADEYRMDKSLLKVILFFLQNCGFVVLTLGIGLFIFSIKNEDGAQKSTALKVIGVAILLFVLPKIAEAGNLI